MWRGCFKASRGVVTAIFIIHEIQVVFYYCVCTPCCCCLFPTLFGTLSPHTASLALSHITAIIFCLFYDRLFNLFVVTFKQCELVLVSADIVIVGWFMHFRWPRTLLVTDEKLRIIVKLYCCPHLSYDGLETGFFFVV